MSIHPRDVDGGLPRAYGVTRDEPASLRHGDPQSIEARWDLRKISLYVEETIREGRHDLPIPIKRITAAAVVANPWIGQPVDSDLQTSAREVAPRLAKVLTDRILQAAGGAASVEAFGKGALVGTAGEIEHGAVLVHTPYFANLVREFLGGDQVIAFADDRGPAGTALLVPMCRKDAGPTRNHFQSASARITDAPRPDEIVIVVAASTGCRPFPRSGDRTTDPVVNAIDLANYIEGLFT